MSLADSYRALGLSERVIARLLADYDATQRERAHAEGMAAVRAAEAATRLRLDPRSERVALSAVRGGEGPAP